MSEFVIMEPPRFIDPRVARGRARSISEATSRFSFLKVCETTLKRAGVQWKAGMSGREAFRFMTRVLKPMLDKHLISFPLIRMDAETFYCGLCEQRGSDGGMDFFYMVCSSSVPPGDGMVYRIEVTQHALQRIIQRTGQIDEPAVRIRLHSAIANVYWFLPWIYSERWAQVGLVCEEGVFVGDVQDDLFSIRTFIPALDNGRPSRWRGYHADIWPVLAERIPRDKHYDPDKTTIGDWYYFASGVSKRHPFLLRPHEPGRDHLDDAWASRPDDEPPADG